jgi:hypothetical protein
MPSLPYRQPEYARRHVGACAGLAAPAAVPASAPAGWVRCYTERHAEGQCPLVQACRRRPPPPPPDPPASVSGDTSGVAGGSVASSASLVGQAWPGVVRCYTERDSWNFSARGCTNGPRQVRCYTERVGWCPSSSRGWRSSRAAGRLACRPAGSARRPRHAAASLRASGRRARGWRRTADRCPPARFRWGITC